MQFWWELLALQTRFTTDDLLVSLKLFSGYEVICPSFSDEIWVNEKFTGLLKIDFYKRLKILLVSSKEMEQAWASYWFFMRISSKLEKKMCKSYDFSASSHGCQAINLNKILARTSPYTSV